MEPLQLDEQEEFSVGQRWLYATAGFLGAVALWSLASYGTAPPSLQVGGSSLPGVDLNQNVENLKGIESNIAPGSLINR